MAKPLGAWVLLLLVSGSYAQQMDTYRYQRELQGITEQWHTIVLPDAIFGKISPDLSDIRIKGVSASNDTIEAPYLLQIAEEKLALEAVAFNRVNTAHNEAGYYFTFEVPTAEAINQLQLNFEQQNFDWKLRLEGSQDQNEWFTMVEDYRILAIKNNNTDYHFSTINFPTSKYRYLRVCIASKEAPKLTTASITMRTLTEGTYRTYPIQTMETTQRKEAKQTEIEVLLPMPVPLSQLSIEVLDTFDYYRPVTIQYCTDSIHTEKGWRYNYRTLSSGTLNSMEANTFSLGTNTITRRVKMLIHNQDNQALNIGTVSLKGYVHQLIARFQTPATYYLVYGNKYKAKPQYDITRFAEKIPSTATALTLGPEQVIDQAAPEKAAPLFENKVFLWVLMIIIIAVLGGFTLKMMSGK
ncbi:DUF3999 family protein [Lewinella sp. LCG006]|uniref:DUF3999 family protein n=1 Tax=Lewinella sp. LCG006 TaxID=3231911 RepID=UPI0034612C03